MVVAAMTKHLRLVYEGPFSLNNQRFGSHWRTFHAENTRLHEWAAMAGADSGVWFDKPVKIEALMLQPKGVLPDADAIAGACKYLIDGLATGDVLVDDSPAYVRSIEYHAPERGDRRSIILLVSEAEAAA